MPWPVIRELGRGHFHEASSQLPDHALYHQKCQYVSVEDLDIIDRSDPHGWINPGAPRSLFVCFPSLPQGWMWPCCRMYSIASVVLEVPMASCSSAFEARLLMPSDPPSSCV